MTPSGANLVRVNGTLFGTTLAGGTGCTRYSNGSGTVYSISTSGAEKVLYHFQGGSDGSEPVALLSMKGMLYGTTDRGGGSGCSSFGGCGTGLSLSLPGKHKVLHRFSGADGAYPWGPLIDVRGALYGTTAYGGSGYGTVYSITTGGVETVLYRFVGGNDGGYPLGGPDRRQRHAVRHDRFRR